jgi:hypothetical protein
MTDIEISIPVVTVATVSFSIDKADWEAMADDQKRAAIADRVESTHYELQGDVLRFQRANVYLEIVSPAEDGDIDLDQIEAYDPEA